MYLYNRTHFKDPDWQTGLDFEILMENKVDRKIPASFNWSNRVIFTIFGWISLNLIHLCPLLIFESNFLFSSYIFARLTVQAKENYFMAVRRHALYNHTDLLGIAGGILALFLSVSLLSITELIFYIVNYLMKRRMSSVSIERRVLKNDDLDIDNN